MSLVMVASVKGSPGVTTLGLALAATWPRRALLAELDPEGGDLRYRLRAADGERFSASPGLSTYAAEIMDGPDVRSHVQELPGGLPVLVGVEGAAEAARLEGRWSWVGALLDAYADGDVIADGGRISPWSPITATFPYLSGLLLVTRPTIDSVGHLRSRLEHAGGGMPPVFVAVVTGVGDTRSARQVQSILSDAEVPATVVGSVAYDQVGAGTLAGEWSSRLSRSALMRSARDIARKLEKDLDRDVDDESVEPEQA